MKTTKAILAIALAAAATTGCVRTTFADNATVGLDSLGDVKVQNELASRGLDDLLNRVFDQDNTPADKRTSIKTAASLGRLSDKSLSADQRQALINNVVKSIDDLLPNLKDDPNRLISLGQTIVSEGVDQEVAIIELWDANDIEKAKLQPMAAAAVKIYDQANQTATARANDIANKIKSPDDPIADQWQKMSDLAGAALYQKFRSTYPLALSMDPASPDRAKLIADALDPEKGLAQWDNNDSGLQPYVKVLMGKMNALKPDGLSTALGLFDSVIKGDDIKPDPTPTLKLEAMCDKVVVELWAGDLAAAQAALADAQKDQLENLPKDDYYMKVVRLLNYRVLALAADKAAPGQAQDEANAKAVTELGTLVKQFPDLKALIFSQLVARMPANPDFTKLDPVVLQAVMAPGQTEVFQQLTKKATNPPDKTKLGRSLGAAREIMARGADGKFDPSAVMQASLYQGYFQEFLGDKLSAVNSMLDHVEKYRDKNPSAAKIELTLESAHDLLADLISSSPVDSHGNTDPEIEQAEDRFMLDSLSPPFNRKQFALDYAARLFKKEKWADAVKYYRMVPADEAAPRKLAGQYGEMVSLKNELDDGKLSPDEKAQVINDIQKLADEVNVLATSLAKGDGPEKEKMRAKSTLAKTSLLAADITRREQKDPERVLKLLTGFEDSVAGLPDSKALLSGALFLRVQSYMQLGKANDATSSLVQYLSTAGGNEGAETVHELLATLNKDLDKARAEKDAATTDDARKAAEATVKQIADNRAVLSGFLVDWAANNPDPKIKAFTYTYRRFAADTKRLSATLEPDPDVRKQKLEAALKDYDTLQTPENFALYQATIPPDSKTDRNYADPFLTLGEGLIDYELANYLGVRDTIGQLVADEKLGQDNDQYWEATYKLLDSMFQLTKSGTSTVKLADVQKSLKILYIKYREDTGGKNWHDKFEELKKQVAPGWEVPGSTTKPGA